MGPAGVVDRRRQKERLRMEFVDGMFQSFDGVSILAALWTKSVIILAVTTVLTRILRGASASLRHILWCAALFSLLLLPLFSAGLQPLRLPVLPSILGNELPTDNVPVQRPEQTLDALSSDSASQAGGSSRSNLPSDGNIVSRSALSWQQIILLVWLIGALLVLARVVAGVIAVRR